MEVDRVIYKTVEYQDFYSKLENNVVRKIDYLETIVRKEKIISKKVAKKLVNTDLYELRILLNNQYRILFFTIDNEYLNQATELLFISGFVKKSTKDYAKEIKKALKILDQWTEED